MSVKTYSRFELAENQLTSAIGLFVSGRDRFSVITLAGAADVIFSRLVMNQGKETFTERMAKKEAVENAAPATLVVYGRGVNDLLFINQLKHMDKGEDGLIDLDVEECALAAVSKALVSYVALAGDQRDIVLVFKAWTRQNLDPKKYGAEGSPFYVLPSLNVAPSCPRREPDQRDDFVRVEAGTCHEAHRAAVPVGTLGFNCSSQLMATLTCVGDCPSSSRFTITNR